MPSCEHNALIRFLVSDCEYALPLEVVAEVTLARRPRLIPFVPLEVAGVINVKGETLPAINAGGLLSGQPTQQHRHALVLEHGGVRAGLLVETVTRIERRTAPLEPAPKELESEGGPDLVRWVLADGERVGLVDPDALLGRIADLLTGQNPHAQHMGEESWPNAF